MTDTAVPQAVALELHRLLRELDPSRWRADLQDRARDRVAHILDLLRHSRAGAAAALHGRLVELAGYLEAHLPAGHLRNGEARAAWQAFRESLSPVYERLAHVLREHAIHVPELRPTNHARMLFHVLSSVGALGLLMILPQWAQLVAAGGFAAMCWTLEYLRRRRPGLNTVLMRHLGRLAHPHETWRVNSSTWFASGLVVLAAIGSPILSAVGLVVLGFADPAAALIGRRYGTIKLVHGRSLQGTLTFAAVGFTAALACLTLLLAVPLAPAVWIALGGALPAALVELFSRSIDDNLSIPLSAAGGAWLALLALGLSL